MADWKFDFAAAAIHQSARCDYFAAAFLDYSNGFDRGAARGPHIFHYKNVLAGGDGESAPERHFAGGVAFDKHCGNTAAIGAGAECTGGFLADNYSTKCGRDDGVNFNGSNFLGERCAQG